MMVDLDTIKPGDRVATLNDDVLLTKRGERFNIPVGFAFTVAKPSVDWISRLVRLEDERAVDGVFLIHKSLIRMADAEPDSSEAKPCDCDVWITGCRCGAFQREQEAKA
jgi:hypothetical protein